MPWQKLTISAPPADKIEFISDFLQEHEAVSVSFEDAGDQPVFQELLNETPLWENTQIQALFTEETLLPVVVKELQVALQQSLVFQITRVEDQNWVQLTQRNFPPQHFADRLWVIPSWLKIADFSGIILRLDPGLGFGTGAHPTTALCLTWLAQQDLANKIVIDYGCGSGILGLAALALGAKTVWAVDHDPQALIATQNNAELNHFNKDSLHMVLPEQLPPIQGDIIIANILANPLCELASRLISHLAPGGSLVLSGFLTAEAERVANAYRPALHTVIKKIQDDWVQLVLKFIQQAK